MSEDFSWLFDDKKEQRQRFFPSSLKIKADPEWVDEYFKNLSTVDPTFDKESGQQHTVESMVEELKARVKLDSIEKIASFVPPLFVKAEPEGGLLNEMRDYVERHHLKPSHGQTAPPALFDAIKEKFGLRGINEAGGMEKIKEMLGKLREEHQKPNPADNLPNYDGTPDRVGFDDGQSKDRSDFIFQDTAKK